MLRITLDTKPGTLTFRLEGRLGGEWVRVLEECWRSAAYGDRDNVFYVDLTELTSIDAAGRACLASLHREGARFIAADCMTKAIVADFSRDAD